MNRINGLQAEIRSGPQALVSYWQSKGTSYVQNHDRKSNFQPSATFPSTLSPETRLSQKPRASEKSKFTAPKNPISSPAPILIFIDGTKSSQNAPTGLGKNT